MFRRFTPIAYIQDSSVFTGLYITNINNEKSLIKRRVFSDSKTTDLFDFKDETIEVYNKNLSRLDNYIYSSVAAYPLVIVKSYKDSANHFGKHDRRKNLLNSICYLFKIDHDVYYLDQEGVHFLEFFEHELEFIGFEDYSTSVSKYSVGDLLIAKYHNISPNIKKGDRVIVEKINNDPNENFYETLMVRKIETGKDEVPILILPKYFKREKKSNYEGIQQRS